MVGDYNNSITQQATYTQKNNELKQQLEDAQNRKDHQQYLDKKFNETQVIVGVKLYLLRNEQDIYDYVQDDEQFIDWDINNGTGNGWQAYIAYTMGPRSQGYITNILVMSHKNSHNEKSKYGQWRRALSTPNPSGNINDGEYGRYIYLWYKTNEDQKGPGFTELYVEDFLLESQSHDIVALGWQWMCRSNVKRSGVLVFEVLQYWGLEVLDNLNEGSPEQHSLFLIGKQADAEDL